MENTIPFPEAQPERMVALITAFPELACAQWADFLTRCYPLHFFSRCLFKLHTMALTTVCYYSQLAQTSSLTSLFLVHFTIFWWEIKTTLLFLFSSFLPLC